jgi:molecular chaperone DnaK
MEIDRGDYEELIEPLLAKTLTCVDQSLSDANLQAHQVDKVVLVGGATRTPMVHRLLQERLGRPVHAEIEPDLAVAMGAAVQGGLIAGVEVGPVLVDITPHTLGIETLGVLHGITSHHVFSPIIERNTPLPATRTEIYSTVADGQKGAEIRVFQGENGDTRYNTPVGEFTIEGLADVGAGNQIIVRIDLDLDGILKVTATERLTGLARHVTIDNAMERFRKRQRTDAVDRLEAIFETAEQTHELESVIGSDSDAGADDGAPAEEALSPALRQVIAAAEELIAKAERVRAGANPDDAAELGAMLADLRAALSRRSEDEIRRIMPEVEDLVFYLEGH